MSVHARFLVPVMLLTYCALAATSIRTKSATWDETNYFGMGDYLLKQRRWDVPSAVIHPPLPYYLSSVPLLWEDFNRRVWTYPPETPRNLGFLGGADIGRGQALLSSPANRDDRLLNRARFMVILQALVLGCVVYWTGAKLYGEVAGLVALSFFVCSPDMLSHGALITPDMTLTLFCFTTMAAFRMALLYDTRRYHLLAGASLGLALLSKFPALLLLPVEGTILGVLAMRGQRLPVKRLAASYACTVGVVFLGYGFDPRPYLQGLMLQAAAGDTWSFLMGQLSSRGWWYYVLVAFLLKTPIHLLLYFGVALVLVCAKTVRRALTLDDLVLWLPIIAFFALFSLKPRSIGLRYVLPVFPFAFVAAAGVIVRLRKYKHLAMIPLLWSPVIAWTNWPDYLAYFNEFAGGPANGYRYLVDSNLDWGQDLKGLKQFMDSRGIDRVYLSYFGSDSPDRYGIVYDWLPSYELRNPNPQAANPDVHPKGYVAISVTNLQGVYMEPHTRFRWLDRYTPIAQIGHSIFVYYVE